jgi:hypothetical protein
MPGGYFFAAKAQGKPIQRGKLQSTVAGDARYRRFSAQVTGNKWLHNIVLKLTFQIEYVKGKAKFFRDSASIVNIIERATTGGERIPMLIHTRATTLVPQLHCEPDQLVALLLQYCCCG